MLNLGEAAWMAGIAVLHAWLRWGPQVRARFMASRAIKTQRVRGGAGERLG